MIDKPAFKREELGFLGECLALIAAINASQPWCWGFLSELEIPRHLKEEDPLSNLAYEQKKCMAFGQF